jgi:hypothetical protein
MADAFDILINLSLAKTSGTWYTRMASLRTLSIDVGTDAVYQKYQGLSRE